jgi:hypothetical protein
LASIDCRTRGSQRQRDASDACAKRAQGDFAREEVGIEDSKEEQMSVRFKPEIAREILRLAYGIPSEDEMKWAVALHLWAIALRGMCDRMVERELRVSEERCEEENS